MGRIYSCTIQVLTHRDSKLFLKCEVTFDTEKGEKGPRAINVTLV
jgi:cold shock CspA family protein